MKGEDKKNTCMFRPNARVNDVPARNPNRPLSMISPRLTDDHKFFEQKTQERDQINKKDKNMVVVAEVGFLGFFKWPHVGSSGCFVRWDCEVIP